MSFATPVTRSHLFCIWKRRPTGSCPFQYCDAIVSFTTATSGADSLSARANSRPASTGIPLVSRYPRAAQGTPAGGPPVGPSLVPSTRHWRRGKHAVGERHQARKRRRLHAAHCLQAVDQFLLRILHARLIVARAAEVDGGGEHTG